MWLTILENPRSRVISHAAVAVLALLPFVTAQRLGDPYEAPRALVAGVAVAALLLMTRAAAAGDRLQRLAGAGLGLLATWYALAALLAQPASSLWGVQGRFQGLISFALLCLAALVGRRLRGRDVLAFAGWVAVALAALSAVVLAQALSGRVPQALFGNQTIAGAWLATATGVAAAAGMAIPAGRGRLLFATAAGFGLLASGASGSRAAVLGALAGVAVVLVATWKPAARKGPVWRRGVWIAGALVLVIAGITVGGAVTAGKFQPAALLQGSARSRLEIWRGTLAMTAEHPVLGIGPGRFLYEFPAYQPLAHAQSEGPDVRPDQAHSHALQYAAEGGVPAAALWLALAIAAAIAAWRGMRVGRGAGLIALGGLAAYLAQAVFGVAAVETDAIGWLLAGVALAPVEGSAPRRAVGSALSLAIACMVVALAGWYVVANGAFGEGVDRFMAGDLTGSATRLERAIGRDPLTDIYRVAYADTATYQDAAARVAALEVLDRGLALEPRSYDCAIARARLLRRMGRSTGEVADAYVRALSLYPLGLTVRQEAVAALRAAGRTVDAEREAALLQQLTPGTQASP